MDTFHAEDVQQILQRAMNRHQEGVFSEQQLTEMATELGISPATLRVAQQEWLQDRETLKQQQVVENRRRKGFIAHLIPYIAVNTFLILLNLVTTPKYFWAVYPLLGWGLGLSLHASCIYFPKEEKSVRSLGSSAQKLWVRNRAEF